MNIRTAFAPGQFRRSPLFLLGFFVFTAVAAWKVSGYIISENNQNLIYVAGAILGGAIVVMTLNNWRNGLYVFLIWLLFEDFPRKYMGNNMAIYFAKDFLAAVLYLSFFMAYRRKHVSFFRPPFLVPLLLFIWFGVMQVFNPASNTLVYGLLGVKVFFYYMPLLFVGYALLNSEAELRRFFHVNIVLVLIIASLGIAQSILGHTFLNPEIMADDIRALSTNYRVSPISGLVSYRPTSIFVSTGRFGDFLVVSLQLILGFTGYLLLRRRKGRNIAFLALAVVFGGILLGVARGVLLWGAGSVIISAAAFVWGAPRHQQGAIRAFRTLQRSALGLIVAVALLFLVFPDALASRLAFYSETLSPGSSTGELGYRAWDYPIQKFLKAFSYPRWPYGYGIGTNTLGTQYVARIFKAKPMGVGVESGYGALIVEMGVGGLLLWLVMSLAIVFSAWRVVKKLKGSPWFPLAFMIFWYAFLLLFPITFAGMQPYQDFVLNAYLWLLLGILFRLPKLALSTQYAPSVPTTPSPRFWIR